jgi:hypothetical protein
VAESAQASAVTVPLKGGGTLSVVVADEGVTVAVRYGEQPPASRVNFKSPD